MAKRIIIKAKEEMKVGILADTMEQIGPTEWKQKSGVTITFKPYNGFVFDTDAYTFTPEQMYEIETYFDQRINKMHDARFSYVEPENLAEAAKPVTKKAGVTVVAGPKSTKDSQK